ncbi:MAG TPA: hypothetical protein VM264_12435 [Acidimicrobiales bacterium]|jgi:hypothetical protein|nr:hypothetical protein [Acidimicrobiales bacterium]
MRYQVGSDGERKLEPVAERTAHPVVRTSDSIPEGALHAVPPGGAEAACGKPATELVLFERDWDASPRLDRCRPCVDAVAAATD